MHRNSSRIPVPVLPVFIDKSEKEKQTRFFPEIYATFPLPCTRNLWPPIMKFCPFELESSWRKELEEELSQPYIAELAAFVELERERQQLPITPTLPRNLSLMHSTARHTIKSEWVIVGQDPYHGKGQAHGLCFSVPLGVVLLPH